MARSETFQLIQLLLFLSIFFTIQATSALIPEKSPPSDLIRSSCSSARYPKLCVRTLSPLSDSARTPADLAQAAVSVSLSRVRRSSAFLSRVRVNKRGREGMALRDCVEQLSDTMDQLRRTLKELKHLRSGTFRWQMSNAETWVSAALTNEDTCLDGFQGVQGSVKAAVRKKVANVARVTSNALYLINRLASTRPS